MSQARIHLELGDDQRYHVYWGGPAFEDGHLWRAKLDDALAAVAQLQRSIGGDWRSSRSPP